MITEGRREVNENLAIKEETFFGQAGYDLLESETVFHLTRRAIRRFPAIMARQR